MMHDLSNYNIEIGKDGRVRAYNKINKTVTSYPRLLMENHLNRKLLKTEDIHHKDENPLNNDIDNLEVMDHREHDRLHAEKKYFDKDMICPICGTEFLWTALQQRTANGNKNKINNNTGPFCSNRCKGINNQRIQAEKGLATKYTDRIEICIGCGKPFLYTAKSQRGRRPETRNKPYCSIECVYRSMTKYTDEKVEEIRKRLFENNGNFAKTEREFGISQGHLGDILKRKGFPYHKKDYVKFSA